MSPNRRALIAAAEALCGVVMWTGGSLLAMNVTTCNGWERNVIIGAGAVVAYGLGMTLFTNARVRHAKRMGVLEGERKAWKEAAEMMEFTARVQSTYLRHAMTARSRQAEKSN